MLSAHKSQMMLQLISLQVDFSALWTFLSSPLSSLQVDSRSFFFDIAPGAESAVSGLVTLLAAAHALRNATQTAQPNRTILYAFFQGVSSSYTG